MCVCVCVCECEYVCECVCECVCVLEGARRSLASITTCPCLGSTPMQHMSMCVCVRVCVWMCMKHVIHPAPTCCRATSITIHTVFHDSVLTKHASLMRSNCLQVDK